MVNVAFLPVATPLKYASNLNVVPLVHVSASFWNVTIHVVGLNVRNCGLPLLALSYDSVTRPAQFPVTPTVNVTSFLRVSFFVPFVKTASETLAGVRAVTWHNVTVMLTLPEAVAVPSLTV